MQLSERTSQLLKNFSSINQSVIIRRGNTLSTMSAQKTILAKATIPDTFEKDMCIYDLSQFLSVLSIFTSPQLELEEKSVMIHDDTKSSRYFFADESLIVQPPTKELNMQNAEIEFNLPYQALSGILKATNILAVPEIAFVGEEGKLYLRAIDSKNPTSHTLSHALGEVDSEFCAIFKPEFLSKLIDTDYNVLISSKKIARFSSIDKNSSAELTYWITVEASSTF
jgi:hypothetical protein